MVPSQNLNVWQILIENVSNLCKLTVPSQNLNICLTNFNFLLAICKQVLVCKL